MYTCPHCRQSTLRPFAVRWSSRETPARCDGCGKLWHVLASSANGILGVGMVLASVAVVAALMLESYLVLLPGIGLVVAHNIWAWRSVELFPISPEAAATAAQVSWLLILFGGIIKLFSN